jgi:hypothetical protein
MSVHSNNGASAPIANCPVCGKDVKKSMWRPEYEGCAGSVVITVKCCGMEALTVELWNHYAAREAVEELL